VNDTRRSIAEPGATRAGEGLPRQGFVFCCFNNNYKITPGIFDGWMRILGRVEGSVLWLLQDNETAAANLRREATRRGIAATRLVFAARRPLPDHLARHRLADLFLDTMPCNAHTTASDALWAGLPVLTRMGATFASRVAASLLHAIGLPELVTETQEAYEATAVALATDPGALAGLKAKLASNRLTMPLFDTVRFTAHIEAAYRAMHRRYEQGLPPGEIHVPPSGATRQVPVPDAHRPTVHLPDRAIAQETIHALFMRGVALHRQGALEAAETIYADVLGRDPNHFDALHLRGVVALQSRRTAEGIALIRQAIALNARVAEAHCNLGNGLRELGHYAEALASFEQAIALKPDYAEAHRSRAATLRNMPRAS
jgi:predicted O-linked N-acetylglucosamine transferase (SPINDLY family)